MMRLKVGSNGVLVLAALALLAVMFWFVFLRNASLPPAAPAATAVSTLEVVSTAASVSPSPTPPSPTRAPAATARPTVAALATVRPQPTATTASLVMRNQTIYALDGRVAYKGDVDLQPTLNRIEQGQKDPHSNDGAVFGNFERRLPAKTDRQYYREYVIRTPGLREVGPQRLIIGKGGEVFYTANHYDSFIQVK